MYKGELFLDCPNFKRVSNNQIVQYNNQLKMH